jgi:hypothetical protein
LRLFCREFPTNGFITYADSGVGHVGTIYKASGFEYVRLTAAKSDFQMPNGKLIQRGSVAKLKEWGGQWIARSQKHLFVKRIKF